MRLFISRQPFLALFLLFFLSLWLRPVFASTVSYPVTIQYMFNINGVQTPYTDPTLGCQDWTSADWGSGFSFVSLDGNNGCIIKNLSTGAQYDNAAYTVVHSCPDGGTYDGVSMCTGASSCPAGYSVNSSGVCVAGPSCAASTAGTFSGAGASAPASFCDGSCTQTLGTPSLGTGGASPTWMAQYVNSGTACSSSDMASDEITPVTTPPGAPSNSGCVSDSSGNVDCVEPSVPNNPGQSCGSVNGVAVCTSTPNCGTVNGNTVCAPGDSPPDGPPAPDCMLDSDGSMGCVGGAPDAPKDAAGNPIPPDGSVTNNNNTTVNIWNGTTITNGQSGGAVTGGNPTGGSGTGTGNTTPTPPPPCTPDQNPLCGPGVNFSNSVYPAVTASTFYTPVYPDGLSGVWASHSAQFANSALVASVTSAFTWSGAGGQCPSFVIGPVPFFGNTVDVSPPCWIFSAIGDIMLVIAVMAARRIIFG